LRVAPGVPDALGGRIIVILHEIGVIIALLLRTGLDDIMRDKPSVLNITPRRSGPTMNTNEKKSTTNHI
jgi:hypothetical protein